MSKKEEIHIIGAGLAGSEAAWQLANRGITVIIHEMRPLKSTPAHKTAKSAELVCSNSLRSDDYTNSAIGLLHQEMRMSGSLIMEAADATKVPAGGALAVDREGFSEYVDAKLKNHPNIKFVNEEVCCIPDDKQQTIIASGPLTSPDLIQAILSEINGEGLNFFDAIA
ncbi:MAG: FAD-dependent oxidoreductase, partial [Alphaproteobacteria bacterium]|nr:FAD-dependent oxidoreductase [Alphaproteobacteria bacterium]